MRKYFPILLLSLTLTGTTPAQTPSGGYVSPATGGGSGGGSTVSTLTNIIDMMNPIFGMKADLRTCVGTQGVLTISSPTFTCTGANFCNGSTVGCPAGQTSDVGKLFNATSGCCNLSPSGSALNDQVVPNNTTILSVQSATSIILSQNATVTQNGASTLYAWWATDDDAAVTVADTAYQNAPVCSALLFPPTPFLVKNPHFNTPNPQCVNLDGGGIGGLRESAASFVGWGQNNSVMYLDSTFPNSVSCTFGVNSNGCFFSMQGANVWNLGINGGWNLVPNGGGHSYSLINPNLNAVFSNDSFVGFAGGDGTSVGLHANAFSFFTTVQVAQFGKNCMTASGNTVFTQGVYGNCYGPSAQLLVSPGAPINTYGVTFGTVAPGANELILADSGAGQWYSYGDYFYGANSLCIFINVGSASVAYIDGATIGGNGTCTTGIEPLAPGKVVLSKTSLTSSTTAINVNGASTFIDGGGNVFSSTGTFTVGATGRYLTNSTSTYANMTGLVPTCTFSTGGGTTPSCTLQAGSTNEKGVIIASTGTGSPGSAGTVTLTFAGTYTGATGAAPACVYNVDNSGTAWGNEAGTQVSTQSTTAPVVAWFNVNSVVATALTVSSPYRIDYSCTTR
jgi:hypothetical protein